MPLNNTDFKELLYSDAPTKQMVSLKLDVVLNHDFLFIFYDIRNDIFIRFDMDIKMINKPTDEQLEITREYFNAFLNK